MGQNRFRVPQIESLMPSVDARNTDKAFVLDGRNFVFDSLGPKSGFTTRQLTPFPFANPKDVQGIRIEGRTFVFCNDAILAWRDLNPIAWELLYAFNADVPDAQRTPWSAIYLNGYFCFAHQYRGFYKAKAVANTQKLWIHPKTDVDIPGLIPEILGMDVVRGRPIFVNATTIQWGSVSNTDDFSPTLGGPGFQTIANFVKGTFLALTTTTDAFIVWTTEGAVLAEFIGDDTTWRFSSYGSQERPYSPWSTINLVNGGAAFLSRRGLKTVNEANTRFSNVLFVPNDWTPDFNEFLRSYLDDRLENQRKWRLEYDASTETIYLSESTNLNDYWRTFVLKPTLNKWGIFSDKVYGFLPLTEQGFGYVDQNGFPQILDPGFLNRETEPDNALGLSRIFPRMEKQHNVISSSVVSRAATPNVAQPMSIFEVPQAGWYHPKDLGTLRDNGLKGLDSWIEIGYLRPQEVVGSSSEGEIEFQQIVLGSLPSKAPAVMDFTTEWNQEGTAFYPDEEDMNSAPTITPADLIEDWNALGLPNIDYFISDNEGNLDFGGLDFSTYSFIIDSTEDLGSETADDEDLNGAVIGLPEITYGIAVRSSQDGITFAEYTPDLQRFNTDVRQWGLSSSGNLHRLRLSAVDPWQYYHVRYLEATITYTGRVG